MISELQIMERRLRLLLNDHKHTKQELDKFRQENEALRSVLNEKDQKLKNFHNQIKITKIVDSISVEEDEIPELKRKLGEYIKEIDKCILHLSK